MAEQLAFALAAAVGGYGTLLALLMLGQRRLIYHPDPTVPEPARAGVPDVEPVSLATRDGLQLLAWHKAPRDGLLPTLVYFHGNAGHLGCRGAKIRSYLDAGLGVLLPAYRGYSGNAGKPSEAGLYDDAEAALDFLKARGIEGTRLVLYGESLGSAVAVEMARRHGARALVLEAPLTSVAEVGRHRFPLFPVHRVLMDRFDSKAKIGALRLPVLIVHGGRDLVIPQRFGRALYAAAVEPKEAHFIPEAGHNDLYEHGMAELVLSFLARSGGALEPAAAPRALIGPARAADS